jgi:hypothetical protein
MASCCAENSLSADLCESNHVSNRTYFLNFARHFLSFIHFVCGRGKKRAQNIARKKVPRNNDFALFLGTLARKERFELSQAFYTSTPLAGAITVLRIQGKIDIVSNYASNNISRGKSQADFFYPLA